MAWLNSFQQDGDQIEKEAFEKLKQLFLNTFPHIAREQTTQEKEKIKEYLQHGFHDYL